MKRIFDIEGLDCANCARKAEEAMAGIAGVVSVSLDFFRGKLTLEAEDAEFESVLARALKAAKRAEPGLELIGAKRSAGR